MVKQNAVTMRTRTRARIKRNHTDQRPRHPRDDRDPRQYKRENMPTIFIPKFFLFFRFFFSIRMKRQQKFIIFLFFSSRQIYFSFSCSSHLVFLFCFFFFHLYIYSCIYHTDKITIYDSKLPEKSAIIDVFCNEQKYKKIIKSSQQNLLIEFETSSKKSSFGFSGKYKFVNIEGKN